MKRWISLIASISMQSCLGVVYAWSTFVPALQIEHEIHPGQAGLIFGVCIAVFTISMIFGGALQQKLGPRPIGITGGILFLIGYWVGSASGGNFAIALTGFGILAGIGIGFAYVCPLATGVKWFPKQKGLITGLAVAGFGLGGLFFANTGQHMLDSGQPVLDILGKIGWIVGLTVILSSLFLFVPKPSTSQAPSHPDLSVKSILKQSKFRALFLQIFCGTFGGLLIIGNLKPIGISIGLTPQSATMAVMLFAIGNAAGRVLWGLLYDRIGPPVILAKKLMLLAGALLMGLIPTAATFYIATLMIAFAFGGCFVLYAARVADFFGGDRISDIYPFVFLGYGIAGLAGAPVGGWLLDISGSPLLPCAAVVIISIVGSGSIIRLNRKSA